jgi:tellurite resistance protein
LKQGRGTINRELDVFHFLKTQRNQEATLNSLTTFEQRRLIKQQVRAGLLVAPVKGGVTKKKRRDAGKLWDSGDEETSSEEDFNFIKQKIQTAEEGKLDDETMKLMRGIIH